MKLNTQDNVQRDNSSENKRETLPTRIKDRFLKIAGWLILLFQSVPALFIWGGLMTLPFLVYLIIMFFSLGNVQVPLITERGGFYFIEALDIFLFGGNRVPEMIVSFIGLFILLYSVIFLRFRKPEGLVTSGPYAYTRHPQYLGVIIFTANLTSRCFRETLGDVGWVGMELTLAIWIGTIFTYIILANIEEQHLTHKFGAEYKDYQTKVGFIVPWIRTQNRFANAVITLFVSLLLMFITAYLAELLHP